MTPEQTAWLAGLIEGEGSFYYNRYTRRGRTYAYPTMALVMTDEDVVRQAYEVAGCVGSFMRSHPPAKREAGHQVQWKWKVVGAKALDLMDQIEPWLGSRRSAKIADMKRKAENSNPSP